MDVALSLNAQAAGAYNTANKIAGQLGVYAGQAAMAAFHAQVMYDPKAVPPPPPLVLAQQRSTKSIGRVGFLFGGTCC
jgi:hypothetical protein